WKDGKEQETEEDNIINNTAPIWRSKPTELKDEDYKKFYRDLYPMQDEPLFYIHLNVDYPFNLTGVLYFPKIKSNIDLQRNKIQLYCNQVFVTDSVENIVPDFLTLLHGVIDSPDIPLNVSRSYLQSDANVKKISKYITKKVSDRLENIFKEDRKQYEEKWDDLKLFINYGMLSEPEFYDKAKNFTLFKDTEGKYFTFDEYKTLIKDNQTDKDGNLIYLYANDVDSQYSFIQTAKDKGYSVLLMDGQLDTPAVGLFEEKFEKSRFTRVDGDIIDRLIQKEDLAKTTLTEDDSQSLSQCFKSQFPTMPSTEFNVSVESMGATADPVVITQSEYMRRMKEMSKIQSGMAFYGQMPDMYSVALNCDHPLIQEILKDIKVSTDDKLSSHRAEIKGLNARKSVLQEEKKKNDKDEATQKSLDECEKSITDERNAIEDILKTYGKDCKKIHQLIDLALLHNGLLKGQSLNEFIKRSIEML
ncbi:MAG: molecular chaperone HtpG, partial [Prevotellaceae bacterium]|nr:molecular chaperone HtpG [Candidatus Faecinaster equi]